MSVMRTIQGTEGTGIDRPATYDAEDVLPVRIFTIDHLRRGPSCTVLCGHRAWILQWGTEDRR